MITEDFGTAMGFLAAFFCGVVVGLTAPEFLRAVAIIIMTLAGGLQ